MSLPSGLQSTGGDEGSQGGAARKAPKHLKSHVISYCLLFDKGMNLTYLILLEGWGMKQDAHCMVILNDFQGFARKNVRGSLGWCHMMISC